MKIRYKTKLSRICWRILETDRQQNKHTTQINKRFKIISILIFCLGSSIPFRVGVFFDDSEAAGTKAELGADDTSAIGDADRGDVGFDIGYTQNLCA